MKGLAVCPVAKERLYLLAEVDGLARTVGVMRARKLVADSFRYGKYTELTKIQRVSAKTLARWDADRLALSPLNGNSGRKSVINDLQVLRAVAEKTQNPHLTWQKIAVKCASEDGEVPHADTIARAYRTLSQKHPDQIARLSNPAEYRNRHRAAMGNASAMATHANALWELDSTSLDCASESGKRYALMAAIDVYSRRMMVLVAPTSNAEGIKTLLRRAFIEWGVPDFIKTDNGKDYKSREVRSALAALRIYQGFCKVRSPWEKPHIERALKTLNHDIVAELPRFLGHSVQDQVARREREAAKAKEPNRIVNKLARLFGVYMQHGLTMVELQGVLDTWCDQEMTRPRKKALTGKTPAMMMAGQTVRKVENLHELDILLADLGGKSGIRTLQRSGIHLERGTFIHPNIGSKHPAGTKVRIKHDPVEEKYLHVFDLKWNFLFTAFNKKLDGMLTQSTAVEGHARQAAKNKALDAEIAKLTAEKRKNNRTNHAAKIRAIANQEPENVIWVPMRVESVEVEAFKDKKPEVTPPQKSQPEAQENYERWLVLDGRVKNGETLDHGDSVFWQKYPERPEFKVQMRKRRQA